MRTVIAGGPGCGKTTYARKLGGIVRHTDDLIATHEWSELSAEAATWFDAPGSWTVDGVRAVHAIRKWLASHPTGKPCDVLVWMGEPKVELTKQQAALLKGCATVFAEVRGELMARGVRLEFR